MAASFCKVELMGTLVGAPSFRRNAYGENICVLPLSVTQQVITLYGRVVDETLRVDVEVGERLAPIVQNGVSQGQVLIVEGRLRQYPLQPRGRMTVVQAETLQILGDGAVPVLDGAVTDTEYLDNIQPPVNGDVMPF